MVKSSTFCCDREQYEERRLHHVLLDIISVLCCINNKYREAGEELILDYSTIFLCKCTDTSVTQDSAYSVPTPSASVTMVISDNFLSLTMVSSSTTGFDPLLFL